MAARWKPTRVKASVSERGGQLQIVLEGGVLWQRFLPDGRRHTIAVYYRHDVINLWRYANGDQTGDNLLALKGTVLGSLSDETVAELRSSLRAGVDGIGEAKANPQCIETKATAAKPTPTFTAADFNIGATFQEMVLIVNTLFRSAGGAIYGLQARGSLWMWW